MNSEMNKTAWLSALLLLLGNTIFAQITDPVATEVWEPVPPVVKTTPKAGPPSDAIILFD